MSHFISSKTIYFKKQGSINTKEAINCAYKRCQKDDIKSIVVATSSGNTGIKVAKKFTQIKINIIPVWLNAGSTKSQTKENKENRKILNGLGINGVQGIQAFSGVERAIFQRWSTAGPVMIISDTLRIFSEGVKVGIEIALMACNSGKITPKDEVLTISGTSEGADTAMVVKPTYSHSFYQFSVKEIICKPRL